MIYRFADCSLDSSARVLVRNGRRVTIQPLVLRLLIHLVERPGLALSRESLLDAVWPDTAVSDNALSRAIAVARRVVGHDDTRRSVIATVPRFGYRLVAKVTAEQRTESGSVHLARLARRLPFVGRVRELGQLRTLVEAAEDGRGTVACVRGDPGVGKTRLLTQLEAELGGNGTRVLWARARSRASDAPHAPIPELIAGLRTGATREVTRAIARWELLSRSNGARGNGHAESAPLQPAVVDAQAVLFDVLREALTVASSVSPLVLLLDDLQWAEASALALLERLAPALQNNPIALVASFRATDATDNTPLRTFLEGVGKDPGYLPMTLSGLGRAEVTGLLNELIEAPVPDGVVPALLSRTEGNPHHVREVLLRLAGEDLLLDEEGAIRDEVRSLLAGPLDLADLSRQRLSRLAPEARALFEAASTFEGAFHLDVTRRVAGLSDDEALAALDEGLRMGLVEPADEPEDYRFCHALLRQTLRDSVGSARARRLHRRAAEALCATWGEDATARAAEVAFHYHASRGLAGAEAGIDFCAPAAEKAERSGAYSEAARYWQMALDVASAEDPRRARLQSRLGIALASGRADAQAIALLRDAAGEIARSEGGNAAASMLAQAADRTWGNGFNLLAGDIAQLGLEHWSGERDLLWAQLTARRLRCLEATDAPWHEIEPLARRRREMSRVIRAGIRGYTGDQWEWSFVFESRADALETPHDVPDVHAFITGEYEKALQGYRRQSQQAAARGEFARAGRCLAHVAQLELAVGSASACRSALERSGAYAARLPDPRVLVSNIGTVHAFLMLAAGEGIESQLPVGEARFEDVSAETMLVSMTWARTVIEAFLSVGYAWVGRTDDARRNVALLCSQLESVPEWTVNLPLAIHLLIEALWIIDRTDRLETLEQLLRTLVVDPDIRRPHTDGRLSMARVLALQGRTEEAGLWFARSRDVLREQGAMRLLAVVDHDEAWMHARSGKPDVAPKAAALALRARGSFSRLDAPGWVQRCSAMLSTTDAAAAGSEGSGAWFPSGGGFGSGPGGFSGR